MALPKMTDKTKVERAKAQILRALEEIKNNTNRAEVLGYVTGQLAHTFATLDADKDDAMAIVFVAAQIMDEIQPRLRKPILSDIPGSTQLEIGVK